MRAAQALLSGCIDYAGLFPPAGLDLATTLQEYARYRQGADAWALGRLVLPAGSLAGFRARLPATARDWPISLLLGPEWENDLLLAEQLGIPVDTIEFRPADVRQIAEVHRQAPSGSTLFFEVVAGADSDGCLSAIADVGACAKIRTGGVTAGAIPSAANVVRFLACCGQRRVAFKATAGLHHALRAIHPLTYEAGSERAPMHGFVNVILAAAMVYDDRDPERAVVLLKDDCHTNFRADADAVHWCEESFMKQLLVDTRERFMLSFGSCSFTEPLAEMRQMRWL